MIELAPTSNEMMTYENAKLYVLFYDHNGHRDWRLPIIGWDDHGEHNSELLRYVTPVRDIK